MGDGCLTFSRSVGPTPIALTAMSETSNRPTGRGYVTPQEELGAALPAVRTATRARNGAHVQDDVTAWWPEI
jgi:hypothetical protein